MFDCPKCTKSFKRKAHLQQHLSKLKPCITDQKPDNIISHPNNNDTHPNSNILSQVTTLINSTQINTDISTDNINSNECPYCKKVFFQKFNVKKHISNNSCKIKKINDENDSIMMKKIKEMISGRNEGKDNSVNNITNITNITNNNITNNIQVNIFSAGKEDLSRLTHEEILKICTSGTYYPIVAAEIIHCNEKYPEFQNFLISNLRSNTGLVFMNDNWISKTQEEILSNIMQIDKKHVSNLIKDLKVDDKLQVKLESTKDEVTGTESKSHQKSRIKSKLYNASKMIMKNKKSLDKKLTN
jgi:hypothetical protein